MNRTFVIPEGAHCELGPSGAKRWMNCARSVSATKDLPNENSVFAASGTASHTLSEWCREQGLKCEEFLGDKLIVGEHSFVVDKERCDSVNRFCEYVYDIGGEMYIEERVYYDHGFGTSDHGAVVESITGYFDVCHIVDFKDGEGVQVSAEWNPQLLHYAIGWWLTYGWLYNVRKFALHIAQPRLNHFVEWWIDLDALLAWYEQQARPAAAATQNPDAPFNPGSWCTENFCKLRRSCKARADAMAKAALDNFEGFDNLDELDKVKPKEVVTLTGAQLAKAYDLAKQVAKWISDLKEHVYAELMQGRDVGGKKLVAGKNARVFAVDEKEVVDAIHLNATEDFATEELYTKPELKSVAQIEELVGKELFAPAKEAGKRSPAKPEGVLYKLVRKVPGAPTIADKDDPRPAVTLNPEEEFENLDANEDFLS